MDEEEYTTVKEQFLPKVDRLKELIEIIDDVRGPENLVKIASEIFTISNSLKKRTEALLELVVSINNLKEE